MTQPMPHPQPPTTNNRPPTTNRSTGPRTAAGKQRSSLNVLRHGLTAASPVLPSEDPAAYQRHCRQFFDEYQPATPTEPKGPHTAKPARNCFAPHSVLREFNKGRTSRRNSPTPPGASTASRCSKPSCFPKTPPPNPLFPLLATLGIHSQRLSRQFQKSLDQLREIQADRADRERRDLKDAAALLELYKHKGIPWQPSDHGFVFSATIYLTDYA